MKIIIDIKCCDKIANKMIFIGVITRKDLMGHPLEDKLLSLEQDDDVAKLSRNITMSTIEVDPVS